MDNNLQPTTTNTSKVFLHSQLTTTTTTTTFSLCQCTTSSNETETATMSLSTFLETYPIILPYGLFCLVLHLILWGIFKHAPVNGPWKQNPHFTAHQLVALGCMIHWTYLGFTQPYTEAGVSGSVLPLILQPNPHGLKLTQYSMGALWLWDIPVSMLTKEMSHALDVIMHAHHIGMLLVTCVVLGCCTFGGDSSELPLPVGSCLAYIYFGRIELSSIPLQIIDLCHPKKSQPWYQYAQQTPWLSTLVESCRTLFAITFICVRGIYFPFVTLTTVLPDFWYGIEWSFTNEQPQYILPMFIILFTCIPFTILQLYWGVLVCKQIYKALAGSGSSEDDTKENKKK
jgi:hypothetical protein